MGMVAMGAGVVCGRPRRACVLVALRCGGVRAMRCGARGRRLARAFVGRENNTEPGGRRGRRGRRSGKPGQAKSNWSG